MKPRDATVKHTFGDGSAPRKRLHHKLRIQGPVWKSLARLIIDLLNDQEQCDFRKNWPKSGEVKSGLASQA